jgi:hypothetical protein
MRNVLPANGVQHSARSTKLIAAEPDVPAGTSDRLTMTGCLDMPAALSAVRDAWRALCAARTYDELQECWIQDFREGWL